METGDGHYPGPDTGFVHWPGLMRLEPLATILLQEDPFGCGPASTKRVELPDPLLRQDDVPPFSALARANMRGPGIRIEVTDPQIAEFAVPSASRQRRSQEGSEIGVASVNDPSCFIDLQIANAGGVCLFKRA